MAMYLRAPKDELGRLLAVPGTMIHERPFIRSAGLAMHDECAKAHDLLGHPWDEGRAAFSEQAGQPLCWSPGPYSMGDAPDYAPTHPCYFCGQGC